MAASLPNSDESVLFQNATNFRARENSEFTQRVPQPASRRLRCESVGWLRTGTPSGSRVWAPR